MSLSAARKAAKYSKYICIDFYSVKEGESSDHHHYSSHRHPERVVIWISPEDFDAEGNLANSNAEKFQPLREADNQSKIVVFGHGLRGCFGISSGTGDIYKRNHIVNLLKLIQHPSVRKNKNSPLPDDADPRLKISLQQCEGAGRSSDSAEDSLAEGLFDELYNKDKDYYYHCLIKGSKNSIFYRDNGKICISSATNTFFLFADFFDKPGKALTVLFAILETATAIAAFLGSPLLPTLLLISGIILAILVIPLILLTIKSNYPNYLIKLGTHNNNQYKAIVVADKNKQRSNSPSFGALYYPAAATSRVSNPSFTQEEYQEALTSYHKRKRFWSSSTSRMTLFAQRNISQPGISDQERFKHVVSYLSNNDDKAFAKELCAVMRPAKRK